jgi:ATP-binding cassette subfamily B protein
LKKKSNIARLMGYAGKFRFLTYTSWALSAISALLALVPFWYLWKIIKEALDVMPDFGAAQHLVSNGWMAVVFAVVSALVYVAGLMCSHISAFRIARNIRTALTHHVVRLPLGFTESFGSGRLRKIIGDSGAAMEDYLAHKLPDKAGAIATPVGLLALLVLFDWRLGLLSLVPALLGFSIMATMTGKRMQDRMAEYQNALEDMSNEAVEYVRGIPVVKIFGQTVFSFKRFRGAIERYQKWVIAYTKELSMPMVVYTAAINSVFAFLLGAAIFFTRGGVTTEFVVDFLFYVIVTPVISLMLTKVMYQSENVMIVSDALRRIDSVLSLSPLAEPAAAKQPSGYSVEMRGVSFSYDGETNALSDVSLEIDAGERVAFVGPSGSGKTTLASLIPRFFDPQSGEVRIGGEDVRDIPKERLMGTVSFVFQNSCLLKASIYDNVRMGRPEATEGDVMKALAAAQCTDMIEKLPNGVGTLIGSKGTYLSGGEQQRIVIARAILKNAPILVLDEATAFADPDNETRVWQALSALSEGKTVLMIAHRLSTVADVDRIFVLENGGIAESGSMAELMQRGGLFKRMWDNYQTSVEWKVSRGA